MRRAAGWLGRIVLGLLVAALLAPTVLPPFLDRVYYRGPVSDHFDGQRFFNPDNRDRIRGARQRTIVSFLTDWGEEPAQLSVTPSRPPRWVAGEAMKATWVGHATVLVQTEGLNILTDPVWSQRASPLGFIGSQRLRAPGIRFDDLPHIDLVLLSHDHYDHLDLATLERLWSRDHPLIVTALGNDTILAWHGIDSRALDWGETTELRPGIAVKAERVEHWSARWVADRNRALWAGFAVTLPQGGNLFFTGDSGPGDWSWAVAAARDGPYRFALIPVGAWLPPGAKRSYHLGPGEAVRLLRVIGAGKALAIHWGTFADTNANDEDRLRRLHAALVAAGIDPGRFRALEPGRSWDIPPLVQAKNGSAATSSSASAMPKLSASVAR
jgi:L-ascorbate metabolism protein UlaG (beta-lactamase superfamily)